MQSVKPVQWKFSEELFSLLLENKKKNTCTHCVALVLLSRRSAVAFVIGFGRSSNSVLYLRTSPFHAWSWTETKTLSLWLHCNSVGGVVSKFDLRNCPVFGQRLEEGVSCIYTYFGA